MDILAVMVRQFNTDADILKDVPLKPSNFSDGVEGHTFLIIKTRPYPNITLINKQDMRVHLVEIAVSFDAFVLVS